MPKTETASDEITIKTNNVPRPIIEAYELTHDERCEFDYLPWEKIENGEDSASFVRYRGTLYDLGEFMSTSILPDFNPLRKWDGYISDSFFSGIVVRYAPDFNSDSVTVGTFYA